MSLIAMKSNYLICRFIDQKMSWPMNGAVCGALCGPLLLTYKNPFKKTSKKIIRIHFDTNHSGKANR